MDKKHIEKIQEQYKKQSPEMYNESVELTLPFFILHKKIYEGGNEILTNNYKLNQTELDVLANLYYLGGENFSLTPTKLYEHMLFSSGGMTKVLKKLEEKKLIKRVDNPEDKRSKLVQITQEGKDITSNSLKEILSYEESIFSKLDEKERHTLKELLLKAL